MKSLPAVDKTGHFSYRHPHERDDVHRWRCMKRNMRHDNRLDRDGGVRLMAAARKLPDYREQDMAELQAEFDERFGSVSDGEDRSGSYR